MRTQRLVTWSASLALGTALGAGVPAHAQQRHDFRVEDRDRDDDRGRDHHQVEERDYHRYNREGDRRGEIRRVQVVHARDMHEFQRPFEREVGWRTQGITYGLVGPLARRTDLTFLDDALLVGSYGEHNSRVYIYVFDLGDARHELEVQSDGEILSDTILYSVR